MLAMDKQPSSILTFGNYRCKRFYNIGSVTSVLKSNESILSIKGKFRLSISTPDFRLG